MIEGHLLEEGRRRLEQAMLPAGGWGYHASGQFFVEPTALALVAFAPRAPGSTTTFSEVLAKSMSVLRSCQREGGYFGTTLDDRDPSWATAPALMALVASGLSTNAAAAGEWLARWAVPGEPPSDEARKEVERILRIDLTLRGWPWQAGEAFATVEPTSMACIALRSWGAEPGKQRISEGLRYLADRICPVGGWNYGNPYFFDDPLPPMTLPTAKGLLALLLCGAPPKSDLVRRSTITLSHLLENNPSRKAHAWGALVFAALGDLAGAENHARAAVNSGDGRGPWGGGPDLNALAVLALRAASGDAPACISATRA